MRLLRKPRIVRHASTGKSTRTPITNLHFRVGSRIDPLGSERKPHQLMKKLPVRLTSSGAGIACLALTLFAAQSSFGAVTWTGASGVDTNWSTPGNWDSGVAPVSTDDVKFFDTGAVATASNIDNIVDPA